MINEDMIRNQGLYDLFQKHLDQYQSRSKTPGTVGRFWEALVSMGIPGDAAETYIHSVLITG